MVARTALAVVAALVAVPAAARADSDLYSIALDGSDRRNLTSSAEWEGQPAISPEGTAIAFLRERGGDVELWLMDADGGNQRPLALPGSQSEPSWSPDGRLLAVTSWLRRATTRDPYRHVPSTLVVETSGRVVRRLPGFAEAVWSPDGAWLAASRADRSELWLLGSSGAPRYRLIRFGGSRGITEIAWAPDSRRLAFDVQGFFRIGTAFDGIVADAEGRDGLYLATLYGRVRKLVDGLALSPAWSPDSTTVAFHWWRVEPGLVRTPIWEIAQDVWTIAPDGPLHRVTDRSALLFTSAPAWSPDGALLAYAGERWFGDADRLYVSRPDGSGVRQVGPDEWRTSVPAAPVWTPDGRRLVYRCC